MPSRSRSHFPSLAVLAGLLLAAAAPMVSVQAAVTLVQDGKPRATIVVTKAALTADAEPKPEEYTDKLPAVRKIAAAARDLQQYVQKITGARLPIVTDDAVPA